MKAKVTVAQAFLYLHSTTPRSQRSQSVLTSHGVMGRAHPSEHTDPEDSSFRMESNRTLGLLHLSTAFPVVQPLAGVLRTRTARGEPKPFQSNHATLRKEYFS